MAHARQQHAGVVGLDAAEVVGTLTDLVREAVEQRLALFGAQRRPGRERLLRGGDRRVDFFRAGFADQAKHTLVDR
jgi:hypothetical protein